MNIRGYFEFVLLTDCCCTADTPPKTAGTILGPEPLSRIDVPVGRYSNLFAMECLKQANLENDLRKIVLC